VLERSQRIEAALLDEQQHDLLGRPTLPHVDRVLQDSVRSSQSSFHLGRIWSAATPVQYGERHFLFVMEVHPLRGFVDGSFVIPVPSRMALAFLIASLFCLLLTRHIVAPMKALQADAQRLAAGDLSTRVLPSIPSRTDELADTARAFDLKANRRQHLIQRRQALLADISHELRSPLTRLSVSLELIQRGETDVAEQMQTDLDRMNAMIGQILFLTRLDLYPPSASADRVKIRALQEAIANDAEFEAQHECNAVNVRIVKSCVVRGDTNLLRSCIENINLVVMDTSPTNIAVLSFQTQMTGAVLQTDNVSLLVHPVAADLAQLVTDTGVVASSVIGS